MDAKVCRFYLNNRCSFGDKCRYAHDKTMKYQCEWCLIGKCRNGKRCWALPDPVMKTSSICEKYYRGECNLLNKYCPYLHSRAIDFSRRLLCYDSVIGNSHYSSDGVRFYTSPEAYESDFTTPPNHAKTVFASYQKTAQLFLYVRKLDLLDDLKGIISFFLCELMEDPVKTDRSIEGWIRP